MEEDSQKLASRYSRLRAKFRMATSRFCAVADEASSTTARRAEKAAYAEAEMKTSV